MDAIAAYERTLSAALLDAVSSIDGASVHGVTDRDRLDDRVPTVSFSVHGMSASAIATRTWRSTVVWRAQRSHVRTRLILRLNVVPGGVVRVSLVHYNTVGEVARFRETLARIVAALAAEPA